MFALIFALAVQSAPPPYLQFMEEAEALGRASYLGGVCTGLGMVASEKDDVVELLNDLERRAILAGTDGPVISGAVMAGIDREKRAVDTIMDLGPDDGSERRQRREAQAVEYLGNGCADLTINYPSVFKLTDG